MLEGARCCGNSRGGAAGNPLQAGNLGVWYQRQADYTFNSCQQQRVQTQGQIGMQVTVKWGRREGQGQELGTEWGSGLWKTPHGAKEDRTEGETAATWGAQLSLPPVLALTPPPRAD